MTDHPAADLAFILSIGVVVFEWLMRPKRSICDKKREGIAMVDAGKKHISLLAIPEAVISTLSGIYDVLNAFEMLAGHDDVLPRTPPFEIQIVGQGRGPVALASGLPLTPHAGISDIAETDIVIVPSVLVGADGWARGRYPDLVAWLAEQHRLGAVLCSACSGVFLLAETGLFDGRETTIHWEYQTSFRAAFPDVPLTPEQVLVVAGDHQELVSSGASNTWHDLVLYLIARHVGPPAAQSIAKFFALQWHRDGLAPYMRFSTPLDHGDAAIVAAQAWLEHHYSAGSPVEEMARRAGLNDRTFKRRFAKALGMPPIHYVQKLRVEEAKKRLERTDESVEAISWAVGYEDPSAFRRTFARITGISPSRYRKKFQVPRYG